jgi:hypothetical protein
MCNCFSLISGPQVSATPVRASYKREKSDESMLQSKKKMVTFGNDVKTNDDNNSFKYQAVLVGHNSSVNFDNRIVGGNIRNLPNYHVPATLMTPMISRFNQSSLPREQRNFRPQLTYPGIGT